MAFMGHTVENPKEEGKADEVSDIQKVLDYFAALSEVRATEIQIHFWWEHHRPPDRCTQS